MVLLFLKHSLLLMPRFVVIMVSHNHSNGTTIANTWISPYEQDDVPGVRLDVVLWPLYTGWVHCWWQCQRTFKQTYVCFLEYGCTYVHPRVLWVYTTCVDSWLQQQQQDIAAFIGTLRIAKLQSWLEQGPGNFWNSIADLKKWLLLFHIFKLTYYLPAISRDRWVINSFYIYRSVYTPI